jgi:Reverse transcriptase (RNA-dependent DNA polymerase)/Transposase IS200 like
MRTSRGVLPVCPRRATLASLPPGREVFIGRHTLERCPQKPVPIPGSQLCSWNTRRELYRQVSNFVGSVVSPVLSNIYLDKLDKFVESTLIPEYSKGDKRERNPAYGQVANQLQIARRQGDLERVRALKKALRKYPSKTPDDPGYRRLRYIRYADDFLFGFAGPFEEANQIKDKVASFLQTELKLTLSAEKTLITHAQTGRARFLGYEIGIMYSSITWVRFLEACFGFCSGVMVAGMSDYRHKRHNVSSLLYHIVCPAKYRRVIFDPEVDTVLRDICLDIAQRYEIAFLEIGTDKDGLDHGVGHPLLLLCHAKAPNYLKKKEFKDLPDYSKWPKVADAVIEASDSVG